MKKFMLVVFAIGLSASLTAQDAAEKKIQAGIIFAYGPTFQKMGHNDVSHTINFRRICVMSTCYHILMHYFPP